MKCIHSLTGLSDTEWIHCHAHDIVTGSLGYSACDTEWIHCHAHDSVTGSLGYSACDTEWIHCHAHDIVNDGDIKSGN